MDIQFAEDSDFIIQPEKKVTRPSGRRSCVDSWA